MHWAISLESWKEEKAESVWEPSWEIEARVIENSSSSGTKETGRGTLQSHLWDTCTKPRRTNHEKQNSCPRFDYTEFLDWWLCFSSLADSMKSISQFCGFAFWECDTWRTVSLGCSAILWISNYLLRLSRSNWLNCIGKNMHMHLQFLSWKCLLFVF